MMNHLLSLVFLVLCSLVLMSSVRGTGDMERWGTDVAWLESYEDGFDQAAKLDKPVFIVIWRSWCDASKRLADKVSKSKEFTKMSKKFVMVNVWTEQGEPWFEEFEANPDVSPNVPRIHFATPSEKLLTDVKCDDPSKDENFTFYYSKVDTLIAGMEEALLKYKQMPKSEKVRKEKKEEEETEEKTEKKEEKKEDKKEEKKKDGKKEENKKDDKKGEEKKPKDGKKKKKKKTEL